MSLKIALTGATGFVGAALLDRFLENNAEINALARNRSKLDAWSNRINVIEGDLDNRDALNALAKDADVFIHCAGVTHVRDDAEFFSVNVTGAERAANAAQRAGARLVHLSSMSAREPGLSPYAASKKQSEDIIANANAITLRLPAIFGPRDTATLPYFKMIKAGFAPEPATMTPARASILYVADAADAIWRAAENPIETGIYEVGDDSENGHSWTEIGETLSTTFDKRTRKIRAPRPLLSVYHKISRHSALLLGKTPDVRTGQINEFFHTDWVARNNLFNHMANWQPKNSLKEGFAKTVQWYQEHGYL